MEGLRELHRSLQLKQRVAELCGALELVAAPGALDVPSSYTVLVASGGITGAFSSVNDPFGSVYPFLDLSVDTTTTTVTASAVPDTATLTSGWGTENQNAVAAALADHPEADRLLTAASVLDYETAGLAFDQLSGQIYPATYFMAISRGVFSKALGFDDLSGAFVPLLIAIPVLIGLSAAFLRKQER